MKIIFCLSYLSVPTTISIIESSDDDFLIVTSNKTLVTFFKRLYPSEKIFLLKPPPWLSKSLAKTIRNMYFIYKYKKELLKKFEQYQAAKVFFFSLAFCDLESWLVKVLSKNNVIYYKPAASIQHLTADESVQAKIGKWLRRLIYSVNFVPLSGGNQTYYAVGNSFLREIRAIDFDVDVDCRSTAHKIIDGLEEIKSSKILILCGETVGTSVEVSEYILQMDTLITSLVEKFGHKSLAIKAHPRFPQYYSKENTLKKIPSNIPANLILGHFDVIVGYSSATLAEAAKMGKKCISLLKMMRPIDINVRDHFIEYLNNNGVQSVHYPKNVTNVIALIASIIDCK